MSRHKINMRFGLLAALFILSAALCFAQAPPAAGARGDTIHITSDRLVAQSRAEYAEFTGNVHAVSDDFDIRSDTLQVFYSQAPEAAPEEKQDETSGKTVKEVIATGNVTILFGDKTATTQKAVYSRETNRVVLTGPGSTVTGPSGRISGQTITLHTETENVTVESGNQNRVQAVIQSKPAGKGDTPKN